MIPFIHKINFADFTIKILIKGFITALLYSSFIYLEYFEITNKLLNSIIVIIAYYLLVTIDKKSMFIAGFFSALFWFWWIGNSFVYYHLVYIIPFILLGIALIYGILFYATAIFQNIFVRIILLYSLNFIEPFGFNWFKIDLPLINTYFNTYHSDTKQPNLKIYMPSYNIAQDKKWNKNNLKQIIQQNLDNINYGIKNHYDLVILPETIFPLILNKNTKLLEILKEYSKQISIIAGSLSYKNHQYLNSTYLFQNQKMVIANKVVLVPFGEKIPLPEFLVKIINQYFFNGASDYTSSAKPTTFVIKGVKFRNAICYEATTDKVYQNLDTHFVIASSNNAWFTPSIEPTLQKLLLKYYAKKYNLIIYHSTNKSQNMIIK